MGKNRAIHVLIYRQEFPDVALYRLYPKIYNDETTGIFQILFNIIRARSRSSPEAVLNDDNILISGRSLKDLLPNETDKILSISSRGSKFKLYHVLMLFGKDGGQNFWPCLD
uniref:Uncharacterized protein n=1 Tax=Romanomermis culicivorax TaxID=13658 RepID=A0A915I6A2_ROMCU